MKSKIFKKIALCFASAIIVCSVGAVAGCKPETDHPEVCITYKFNGESYAVQYRLYRNMYPHTVKHFIELADEGFYNSMIIHNYQTNDWFTGGYSYDEAEYSGSVGNIEQMVEYFEQFSKEDVYSQLFAAGKLSASVYSNHMYGENGKEYVSNDDALPTVMGEFYNNITQEIENGALTAEFGCLKMFYYEYNYKKDSDAISKVYVTPTDDQIILADYKSNCATSLFALQVGQSSSYSENDYAVFAKLKETEAFENFVDAVKDYISDNHSGTASEFYTAVKDLPVGSNFEEVTFNAPKQPIIVESVKVTKY